MARQDLPGLTFLSLGYEPGVTLGWHVHPRAYLSFVGAGSYTERLGRSSRHCGTSTLLLHAAGERHANLFHDSPVRLLRVEANEAPLLEIPRMPADGHRSEPSRHLCRRMLHELHAPDDVTPIALHGLLLQLVAGLSRASAAPRSREPSWLARVEELLYASFAEPLGLAEIAVHAGVHPVHLARTWRRHRRGTIGERIRELRLEHACRLLANSGESIADVAHRCGFSDQSHLARVMRARLGVTPTRYRAERAAR